jgi:hypothetical protein
MLVRFLTSKELQKGFSLWHLRKTTTGERVQLPVRALNRFGPSRGRGCNTLQQPPKGRASRKRQARQRPQNNSGNGEMRRIRYPQRLCNLM